jgi:hypothetical protein
MQMTDGVGCTVPGEGAPVPETKEIKDVTDQHPSAPPEVMQVYVTEVEEVETGLAMFELLSVAAGNHE